ncbi:MAG: ATP-binding protein [Vicinamibacterales bacterium]
MDQTELTITLRNDRREIARLTSLLEEFCARHGLNDDVRFDLNLVLDEAVSNVINHGFEDTRTHDIVVRIARVGACLRLEVEDDGVPYNPLDAPQPRFDLPVEQRRIGGLGVHIMKTLANDLEYRRQDGRNHLIITLHVGDRRVGIGPS